jgi:short subunit dehydrogenase-like uncharacterized protein
VLDRRACCDGRSQGDINGETPWIRRLIDRYHAQTAAHGTRIIICRGYDSIPSDYGAWLISRHIREVLHSDCVKVTAYFRMDGGGGMNGGTLASALHFEMAHHPFLLDPDPASHGAEELRRNADPAGAHYDTDLQAWVTPFCNGVDQHPRCAPNPASARTAVRLSGVCTARRWIIKRLLPKPGEGPSEKAMNEGFVECEFIGTAKSSVRARGVLKGKGDAGNWFTVKRLCESAFALAQLRNAQYVASRAPVAYCHPRLD